MCLCDQSLSCVQFFVTPPCSQQGSSVHGILQARILGQVAISFSRGYSSQGRSTFQGLFLSIWLFHTLYPHTSTTEKLYFLLDSSRFPKGHAFLRFSPKVGSMLCLHSPWLKWILGPDHFHCVKRPQNKVNTRNCSSLEDILVQELPQSLCTLDFLFFIQACLEPQCFTNSRIVKHCGWD